MTLKAKGLHFMGRGVAYAFDAPELAALRGRLARWWEPRLGAQDRQRIGPHITVQNHVPANEARAPHERVMGSFSPFEERGEGVSLWRYAGGPWQPVGTHLFGG